MGAIVCSALCGTICSGSYHSSLTTTISLDGYSMQLSSYWCIGYTPPLILTSNRLQICSIPGTDHHVVSLWTAVDTYLYPYAEISRAQGSPVMFSVEHTGSPSIQNAYGGIPSIDSLFRTVIRSIGCYIAVDSFQLYGNIPSFNLDANLVVTLRQDLRITLMTFVGYSIRHLLILVSFLSTGVRQPWLLILSKLFSRMMCGRQDMDQLMDTLTPISQRQLIHHFLRFPPCDERDFFSFVSGRLLGPIASLRGFNFAWNPALSMILNAFVTGLESDVLNPETFQQCIASPKTSSQ
ncbi:hypothetical protein EV421DRAFT_1439689 [Armillaria borealis]|uniref:Uncharacterized protein n=1 Tax=Armillaria borealis TaxID=47425 RepID=A0AA39J174_9AGAR|nr:hypothetical protein EV421DRAFT_1439689 [Armillaria borealis]